MTSSYTTNKSLEKPANGDYVNTWNMPVNGDMDIIDQAFGGVTSLNATSGSATLTSTQYRSLILAVAGAMSANVTYTIPSGVGGQWIVYNSTTDATGGPWTITFASGGGGLSQTISRLSPTVIYSDGSNIRAVTQPVPGSNTQLIFNSSGAFAASSGMTWNGTTLTASAVAATNSLTAGTTVSDSIGNLRTVPANSQGGSYVLVATDAGKYISISSGTLTVPNSIFSAGQTISIYNNSSSNLSILQGSGVVMTLASTTLTGNRTLANYGLATLLCTGSGYFVITGAGLS